MIGHDEVVGLTKGSKQKHLKHNEGFLPVELFLDDVLKLHAYITKKGINVWMWGDMLLNPRDFKIKKRHMHGRKGYAEHLHSKLPKDIVICDWQYIYRNSYPTSNYFSNQGFNLLGATFKNIDSIYNFSNYHSKLLDNSLGMIATMWFHIRPDDEKHKKIVEDIILNSSEAFWNAEKQ